MRRPKPGDTDDLVERAKANRVKAQRCTTGDPNTCGLAETFGDDPIPCCSETGRECDKREAQTAE